MIRSDLIIYKPESGRGVFYKVKTNYLKKLFIPVRYNYIMQFDEIYLRTEHILFYSSFFLQGKNIPEIQLGIFPQKVWSFPSSPSCRRENYNKFVN